MRYIKVFLLSAFALSLFSCDHPQPKVSEVTTEAPITHIDSITVYCDESFRYLMGQEALIYETAQPAQHLHIIYVPESEAVRRLMTDSFSTIMIGRRLSDRERDDIFRHGRLQTDERCFAKDAIAIVANPSFEHDTLAYDLVSQLIAGSSRQYELVFEGNGSGAINYMFTQFGKGAKSAAFAAKNMDELVSYLQKDAKAIGFIPFVRISDDDDSLSRDLLKKVKVLSVAKADSTGKVHVTTASQSEIADGSYPFARPINFISHSMDEKVGTGFVNFLSKEQSGRIILKTGLVPAIMPQRVIHVNTDGIK